MAGVPDLAEIAATVTGMEDRYDANINAAHVMAAYRRVRERFADDLTDPRDLALAKSAALMMVRELVAESPAW